MNDIETQYLFHRLSFNYQFNRFTHLLIELNFCVTTYLWLLLREFC